MDELTSAMNKDNEEIAKNPLKKQMTYADQMKPFSENLLVLGQNKIDKKRKVYQEKLETLKEFTKFEDFNPEVTIKEGSTAQVG